MVLGSIWERFGTVWGLLWALLGSLGALLGALGALLGASQTPLGRNLRKILGAIHLLGPNLDPKIQPSWLQNPSKIDVKKQPIFKHVFSSDFKIFDGFLAPNSNDFLYVLSLVRKNVEYVKFSVFSW